MQETQDIPTETTQSTESPKTTQDAKTMDDSTFSLLSDRMLQDLCDEIDQRFGTLLEVDYQDGVLTIQLESEKEYVINRHLPNLQIWVSSPVSGPNYFTYNVQAKRWYATRDPEVTLSQLILDELAQILEDGQQSS